MYAMGTSLSAVLGRARPDGPRRGALRHSRRHDQRQRHRADGEDDPRGGQPAHEPAKGPTFIEAQTYRYKGHSISDPAKYRRKDELESAVRNDPIVVYENVLKQRGWIDQETRSTACSESVKQEVEESIEFAEQSEPPPLDALYEDITVAPFIPQE